MIDYEVKIFNRAHAKAASLCAKNHFVSKVLVSPSGFPAASLIEMDNETVKRLQSSTPKENFARITYQLEVYAMSKSECRTVFAAVDEEMISMNFSRISGQYINNAANPKVFRYVARYEALIDTEGNLYRAA